MNERAVLYCDSIVTIKCELPVGHTGDHMATLSKSMQMAWTEGKEIRITVSVAMLTKRIRELEAQLAEHDKLIENLRAHLLRYKAW